MENLQNIILYGHGGSGNHGCEAIVRSTGKILSKKTLHLMSSNITEDIKYGVDAIVLPYSTKNYIKKSWHFIKAYLKLKLFKEYIHIDLLPYSDYLRQSKDRYELALSIGGDNYCYGDTTIYQHLNKLYNKNNIKTAFVGCSIEPNTINQLSMLDDLRRYSLIIARESLTYDALIKNGLSNVKLLPDPAFQLDQIRLSLPSGFIENNMVGINISPYVIKCEKNNNITLRNYEKLIEYIIYSTDMSIALIPHVVWIHSDDREPLKILYNKYKNTGRVVALDDYNCMELKGFIARCRFMIAARTHASIAAYSTCVPTLVVGYSVKAKGIAKDIFGTFENYVLPVQALSNEDDLQKAFKWLYENEITIKTHLNSTMPKYREEALLIKEELEQLIK